VLISTSVDYVAECFGRASSGWCCPWREIRERISFAQRLPGTDVSSGALSICFGVYVWLLQWLRATDGYPFGSDDRA